MEEKSIKDFDRAIEQAMNESAVPPPFGAWNRIAAQLDAPAAAPIAAASTFPRAAVGGFVAGALLIGSIITGVLVYNGNTTQNITQPLASNQPTVNEAQVTAPVVAEQDNVAAESNTTELTTIAAIQTTQKEVVKPIAVKSTTVTAKAAEKKNVLANNNDVAVPEIKVANHAASTAPYYFPPVDITMDEQPQQSAAPVNAITSKETSAKLPTTESKKRISSSSSGSDFHGIKFKKKRKTKFTYGRIVSTKKR